MVHCCSMLFYFLVKSLSFTQVSFFHSSLFLSLMVSTSCEERFKNLQLQLMLDPVKDDRERFIECLLRKLTRSKRAIPRGFG